MNVRAQQTAARRQRILDAAGGLIRSTGSTDFTMLDVATSAGVSPATPYNLFGSKNGLLYEILNRSLDGLVRGTVTFVGDPLEHPIAAGEVATDLFIADPSFFRPLFLVMLGVPDEVHRPRFLDRSLDYWRHSLEAAEAAGMFPAAIPHEELSRLLLVHYIGALDLWAHDDLDGGAFRAQVTYGIALELLAITDPASRTMLLSRMENAKRQLPIGFAFVRVDREAVMDSPSPALRATSPQRER